MTQPLTATSPPRELLAESSARTISAAAPVLSLLVEPRQLRTQGDRSNPPTLTCLVDGRPVDLTGAVVTLRLQAGDNVKAPAVVVSDQLSNPGELVPTFAADEVDEIGNWEALVLVIGADELRATYRGAYLPIVEGQS